MFKSVGYFLYASSFLLLLSSSHCWLNFSHYVTAIALALLTASRSLIFVDSVIVVVLPLQGSIVVTIVLAIIFLIAIAVSGYLRFIAVDCWLISTNSDWLAVMVPMEPHVPSWYHRKAWSKNRSMMVPNGTKSPGMYHRKPGTMVPWYPNLWIYCSVRTALWLLAPIIIVDAFYWHLLCVTYM